MGERTSYTPGTSCWVDLASADQRDAKRFYTSLFGWDYEDVPLGEGAFFSTAHVDRKPVAAIVPLPDPSVPPHWNCYVSVEDADAAAARAQELGATVILPAGEEVEAAIARAAERGAETLMGPIPVPSGRFAVLRDPQNAVFSVVDGRFDP
jgi:predicted enzyme related to lactoylglutathione lyase